jgi:aminoglycoside phosphotransferase (APT) family kinase protein
MSFEWIDRPGGVRPGEELDTVRLAAFLREHLPALEGPLEIEQFPRGFSNLTYLVRLGRRELVLRRPPIGADIKSAHDMGREHRILSHLDGIYDKVPTALVYCDDLSVLGAPFYLMERVEGIILRSQMPAEMRPDRKRMAAIADAFVETLAELHAVDFAATGLGELGHPEGYVRRQVDGWSSRYANARTDEIPEMTRAASWLDANAPPESGAALIHNDFKYDNLVLDPANRGRVIAVLDWEMATLGDPLMDLGTTLGYWVDPQDLPEMQSLSLGPTTLPGNPTRAELAQRYATASGRELADPVFYYVYGLFKIAVIIQQIYCRYRQGHTRDARFAHLIAVVRACARTALQAATLGRIDHLF